MHRSASAKNVRNASIDGGSQHSAATDSRFNGRNAQHRILVPFHNVNICSTVLHKNDFNRVKTASRFYTKEERQRQLDKIEEDQKRLQEESERRKNFLQYIDEIRNDKLRCSGEQFHMKDPAEDERILSRAFWAKHEQEDEVKRANRIILAKKVHMVQDAQINEKREFEKEWRENQLRLENDMLEKDKIAMEQQKKLEEYKKILRDRYANDLRNALQHHESKKYLEAQRIENEAKVLENAKIALKLDEESKEKAKRERIERVRHDIEQAKRISTHYKTLAFESKRIAEMKAQEYMQFKAEQQRQIEKEKRFERERKQRETDRILARQTQLLQTKQRNEEAQMRRIQEQKERQFRMKVLEAARKRHEMLKEITAARSKQIEDSQRMRAKQDELEAIENRQLIAKMKKFEDQERIEKEKLNKLKENYRKEILNQIATKEKQKSKKRELTITELNDQQREEEKRQQNIRRVLEAKVKAMRDSNIPEKLVRDVERQLNLK